MILRWLLDGTVVDGSTLKPPKNLTLEAVDCGQPPPKAFTIARVYNPLMAEIRNWVHASEPSLPPLRAVPGSGPGEFRSDRDWLLPHPGLFHWASQYVFTADIARKTSGRVRSSGFGGIDIGGELSAALKDPAGIVPFAPSAGVNGTLHFTAAVDPEVTVTVLTGQRLVDFLLGTLLTELQGDGIDATRGPFLLGELRDGLIRRYTPPPEWQLEFAARSFHADDLTEHAVDFRLETPVRGEAALAFEFTDADRQGEPDAGVLSDAFVVSVDPQGVVRASLNFSDYDTL